MTRPAAAPAPRPGRAATAAMTALLVATGAAAWSWPLGGSLLRIAPLAAAAVVAVLLAAGWLARRLAAGLLVVWLPAAVWAAGVPAGQLLPPAWPWLVARLTGGVGRLTALGSGSGPIGDDPWPLAAWLLGAGLVWVAGATLAASRPSSARRRAIAFAVLTVPWIAAVAARQTDQAAWQGAAVLLAGLLWFTDRRGAVQPVLALGLAAALVSVATAQAVGPRTSWVTPASLFGAAAPFRTLQTGLTYGPLQGRRSGATMLEVTAAEPALWRMRVLDVFVEDVWGVRPGATPKLPQPAARVVEVKVRVRGLRNDLVVAPGRIDAVHADGRVSQAPGEAWWLAPPPHRGDTYRVRARLVRVSAEQLRGAPAPTDPRLRASTGLDVGRDQGDAANHPSPVPAASWRHRPEPPVDSWHRVSVPLFGQGRDPRVTAVLDRTPYAPVAALARRLAAGATSQWDVVARVHRYLLDGGRFRYTTNPPQAGPYPLVDFLLRGHAGSCQHFAGAAALLLRLAGVPTRVVVGFATGVPTGDGRFEVRDLDAHAWIEVYFQGSGWVAFNPTPPAAPAHIPRRLDPLAPAPATTGGGHGGRRGPGGLGGLAVGAILTALATAAVRLVRRRTRRGPAQLGPLLEDLVRRSGGHVHPSSTLAELGVELARLVGPNTAALAALAERARFAPDPATSAPRLRTQIARTLASDLGPIRALLMLIAPAATHRARNRPQRTA
jgi:protein-glutamine gamma-glutamyltransferase